LNTLTDGNQSIKVSKNPSNLTEVPRVAEKYEINSFCRESAQYSQNLKTLEIIRNQQSGQPILNLNAGFFGGSSELAAKDVPLHDTFADVLAR
jgi:hypothetical protein